MPGDTLTVDDIRRAVEHLKTNNVQAPYYTVRVHPANAADCLIVFDPRLSYGDRLLARERSGYERRRVEVREALWRDPYEWICLRLGLAPIEFSAAVLDALGPGIVYEVSGG